MVKIEVTIKDGSDGECQVRINKPKHLKSATDTEKATANALHATISNTIKNLSKGI